MARVTRLSWMSSQIYLGAMAIGSLGAALWMFRMLEDRGGFAVTFAAARAEGLRATLLVGAPVGLLAAAAAGLVLLALLRKRARWALVVAALSAPVALGAIYAGHRLLLSLEERLDGPERYARLYRGGACAAVAVIALHSLALALDVLVVARRRAA